MQVVDLTHFLSQGMPVYPGTEGPRFESANTYERDGFQETRMTMYTHTGTHVDPPAHLFPGGATLDRLPITQFVGTALVIDCTDLREGGRIAMDRVERRRADADMAEFLLFAPAGTDTGETRAILGTIPASATTSRNTSSRAAKRGRPRHHRLDPIAAAALPLHKKVLANNAFVIIENLTNLHLVGHSLFTLCALPLKHVGADGSPIRAIGLIED